MNAARAQSQTTPVPETDCTTRVPRVLLAEDDQELRELIASALRQQGYDVVEARDGVELLGYLEAAAVAARGNGHTQVAAVVSDVRMPSLTGLDVLAVLAAYPLTCCTVPFILITAFGDDSMRAEAHALGANRVLEKPLDLTDLRDAVRQAMPQ